VTFIAVLEGDGAACDAMYDALEDVGLAHRTEIFETAVEAIAWLDENLTRVSLICLDDAPDGGQAVADWLATKRAECPVLLHGGTSRQSALAKAGWTVDVPPAGRGPEWIRRTWIHSVHEIVGLGA